MPNRNALFCVQLCVPLPAHETNSRWPAFIPRDRFEQMHTEISQLLEEKFERRMASEEHFLPAVLKRRKEGRAYKMTETDQLAAANVAILLIKQAPSDGRFIRQFEEGLGKLVCSSAKNTTNSQIFKTANSKLATDRSPLAH